MPARSCLLHLRNRIKRGLTRYLWVAGKKLGIYTKWYFFATSADQRYKDENMHKVDRNSVAGTDAD